MKCGLNPVNKRGDGKGFAADLDVARALAREDALRNLELKLNEALNERCPADCPIMLHDDAQITFSDGEWSRGRRNEKTGEIVDEDGILAHATAVGKINVYCVGGAGTLAEKTAGAGGGDGQGGEGGDGKAEGGVHCGINYGSGFAVAVAFAQENLGAAQKAKPLAIMAARQQILEFLRLPCPSQCSEKVNSSGSCFASVGNGRSRFGRSHMSIHRPWGIRQRSLLLHRPRRPRPFPRARRAPACSPVLDSRKT